MEGSNVAEWIAAIAAVMTAGIIYGQARLLIQQNQISALIQMQKEWDSARYRMLRSRWAANPLNLKAAEPILEFLEDFAGFGKRDVFDDELIRDTTLGWHAARYYYYNHKNGNISSIRQTWAADHTIFV